MYAASLKLILTSPGLSGLLGPANLDELGGSSASSSSLKGAKRGFGLRVVDVDASGASDMFFATRGDKASVRFMPKCALPVYLFPILQ
jgi:hypothetical protein